MQTTSYRPGDGDCPGGSHLIQRWFHNDHLPIQDPTKPQPKRAKAKKGKAHPSGKADRPERSRMSKADVDALLNHPGLPTKLRLYPATGHLLFEDRFRGQSIEPKYWAIRVDNVISPDQQTAIADAFQGLQELGALKMLTNEKRHGDVIHTMDYFGSWNRQGNGARSTASTAQGGDPKKQLAVLKFLGLVDSIIMKVRRKVTRYDPEAFRINQSVATNRDYRQVDIDQSLVAKAREDTNGKPWRLGLLGTTMAVQLGFAGEYHVDGKDYLPTYSILIPIASKGWDIRGQMTGHAELPQLAARIPVRPGQAMAFQAHSLIHRCSQMTPAAKKKRLLLTVFTDQFLGMDTPHERASSGFSRKRAEEQEQEEEGQRARAKGKREEWAERK